MKSCGSLKLTKPNPLVLLDRLSRTTFAFRKDWYLLKALVRISSVTSLPKSPQKIRKSSEIEELYNYIFRCRNLQKYFAVYLENYQIRKA